MFQCNHHHQGAHYIELLLLLLQAQQLHSLKVLAFSTYNFHFLRSRMQLVQFFIFSFFIPFIISTSHLFFGLPSGRVNIGFHLYTLFTILSSGIRFKWPNQLNLYYMSLLKLKCFSALPDDGDYTETCRSCFKVNVNTPFKTSVGNKTLIISR